MPRGPWPWEPKTWSGVKWQSWGVDRTPLLDFWCLESLSIPDWKNPNAGLVLPSPT